MSVPGRRSAVITGIGLVTPVGSDLPSVFDAVCTGRSGLRKPPAGHPLDEVAQVAGIGPEIDPTTVLPRAQARTVDRFVVMALAAADSALADAGLAVGRDVDPYRAGVIVSGVGGFALLERNTLARDRRGRVGVSPYLLAGMLPGMGSAYIAIKHGIQGYSSTIGTACAAGAQSIGEALRLIRGGDADIVVCGASEAQLFPTFFDAFGNAWALAHDWDDPTAASRPFDLRRNGFVLAEGAAVLILESPAHADARGAAGYADVVGWGATTDAHHPTTPRPDGASSTECMRRGLADAGIAGPDVGYVNAHGTGTKLGDVAESRAITAVFGDSPPVSSIKSLTGHMLGASGAVEAAVTAAALSRGVLPPTWNLDDPDPACDLDHVREKPRSVEIDYALSNSFGFGGHNISLVLGRPSTRERRSA
ncbi:MAG TPA: beta-ketoacyl-[acyl-carrier-protein] synthase family protein [Streptosporangiaceae bacterium]|nr:beta-ketoacyl-[acyl-carrier-protein] synthase family protein [Streptosporangiaceae bacterium]